MRKETPPPCLVSRNLPIFHLSIHRAVQDAIAAKSSEAEQNLAAAQAARMAFLNFFPSQTKLADDLSLNQPIPAHIHAIATAAVERTFRERENDGSSTTIHYVPSDEPGQWRRTPPNHRPPEFPHWGEVKPFILKDVKPFRAPPPPALNSEAYAKDLNEVRELGGKVSTKRTAEQTLIAKFWADFSYTTSPAGHWNDIAREISLKRQVPIGKAAELFATLNLTMADTCITIWDSKYHYNYWRPVTAIQRAEEDNNAATATDKAWEPLLVTPPHPEYVSGHSGVSGAAAAVLEHYFGFDEIHFSASSDDVRDVKRQFTSFKTCAEEISRSRVYGGIHFTSAGREGLILGRKVAVEVLKITSPSPTVRRR
ncbi:MAG: vanadium-dependent haloperoxidase [Verrucomicrobiaceae bacterium]|nr:vanadium-dependent haloperoxidase [Verrucomicrobiaceae bacterium]